MLDPKLTELTTRMIGVRFDERRYQFPREIDMTFAELATIGLASSSAALNQAYKLCTKELKLRTSIVRESLFNVFSKTDLEPSDELSAELKKEVEKYLAPVFDELTQIVEESAKRVRSSHVPSLKKEWDRAISQLGAEIDVFLLTRSYDVEKEERTTSAKNVFNITGNLGAVQTGHGSTANVIQVINSQDQELLLKALDDVREHVESGANLPGFSKEEALELLEETLKEVDNPSPNKARLKSFLMTVAIAVQTVGNLKPAYEAIKSALTLLGLSLP